VTRSDFQLLALERLQDAEVLFANGRFGAAYYLAGYAVECALKACIARRTREFDFPDKLLANQIHTHDLKRLVELSQLTEVFKGESRANSAFRENWETVRNWSEDTRYRTSPQVEADDMLKAVGDPLAGVLQCIRKYW
jgi:AbiV family abortive infection protein